MGGGGVGGVGGGGGGGQNIISLSFAEFAQSIVSINIRSDLYAKLIFCHMQKCKGPNQPAFTEFFVRITEVRLTPTCMQECLW